MEGFYTILYYKPTVLNDELLAVGLLVGGGEGPYFFLSMQRLHWIKKIIHPRTYFSLERHLLALKNSVDIHRKKSSGGLLFDPVFSKERFDELSLKLHNSITYSAPTSINNWITMTVFEVLVNQFFNEDVYKKNTVKRTPFHLAWKAFCHSKNLKKWEHNILLHSIIPETQFALTIELIDKEKRMIIKGVDFDWHPNTLRRKSYEIELIKNALPDFSLMVIHPLPKKSKGKQSFARKKEEWIEIQFMKFTTFKKWVKNN